jgi:hypothetical protein
MGFGGGSCLAKLRGKPADERTPRFVRLDFRSEIACAPRVQERENDTESWTRKVLDNSPGAVKSFAGLPALRNDPREEPP